MSQTLYRKYRSQTFAELIGQEAVLRVLRNSIVRGRLNHAYLFCGPRGTGKTSVARIFAKALNCLEPREGDACGVCENCLAVANGTAVDVVEIDAASNRSVEDVEDLRKRVGYSPLRFRYKVYIIDEVHMISTHGFNALLKTLEEPPGHVVFCLCTTEANKLPVTILSRCIRFDFTRLAPARLAAHLQAISAQEGLSLADDAALELAELAEGSARDAISLLDQLTVYCTGKISLSDIRELFQLGDPALRERMITALSSGEPRALIGSWDELAQAGMDASRFLLDLAGALKQRHLAEPAGRWRRALEAVWQGLNLLKYDNFPALLVELTLLEAQAALTESVAEHGAPAASEQPQRRPASAPALQGQPQSPARTLRQSPVSPPAADGAQVSPAREPRPGPQTTAQASASPASAAPAGPVGAGSVQQGGPTAAAGASGASRLEEWERFLAALERISITTYALLWRDVTGSLSQSELRISFPPAARQQFGWVQEERHVKALNDTLVLLYGRPLGICAGILGEDESQLTLLAAATDSGAAHRREAALPPGDLPDEIVYDSVPAGPDPRELELLDRSPDAGGRNERSAVDPASLADLERMTRQVDAALAADVPDGPRRMSADEAASLFEADDIAEDVDADD